MISIRSSQTAADIFLYLSPFFGLLIALLFGGLVLAPLDNALDRWDRASVIRICRDGTKVFRMEDGEYRVRSPSSLRSFHAASADVCG